jgi:poly-gamma-glutamate synthesis protein (capsule biosynthesis protein)
LLRDADVATANYEGNIIDGRTFRGTGPGGFGGTPDVAADAKAMGFDLVARSNNHAGEYGYDGLLETNSWLDKAGIVYAGSGEKYASARAARFVSTAKGRVGMVATASSYAEAMMAQPGRGEWPGRGGQSALRYTRFFMTPPAIWQSVKAVRDAFPNGTGFYVPANDSAETLTILGERFRLAPNAAKPYYSYQMNEQDLRDLLAAVTEGKTRSDFMTFAIHAHQFQDTKGGERGGNEKETDDLDTNPSVADFLPVLAKAAIDAGADAFLGTGVHVVRGIEIYKGRPIFYGLGEFFRQMDVIGLSGMGGRGRGDENSPPIKYESIVAVSRYEHGTLAEIRLHPIEITDQVRMAHRGIPRLASPQGAQRILARLQKLSAPFGTTIAVEGNIGVIRPRPAETASGAR